MVKLLLPIWGRYDNQHDLYICSNENLQDKKLFGVELQTSIGCYFLQKEKSEQILEDCAFIYNWL